MSVVKIERPEDLIRSSKSFQESRWLSEIDRKHNIRQRTLTAYELFETSSASRRLGDIRHCQSEKFAKEREFTGVTLNGIENKSVRAYHQQKLPNLTSMPPWRNTYPDVAESVKEYFDQSDDKALNWNSCDLEELNDWENMLYRLFIYRTDNIIKKFEKYRLLLYSEILRRQTPQQK
ncbi:uncharacterized protein TRIADDRAFT_57132 [Trichoplax adhaerens]|uniref:Uncharacterized protein n=1 Tax=Trichoplax adhaerens TaxID=10228 RepID=B3S0Q1_TRIAD|nr:predicted protein [Trichoplax adhaerens]EDV24045.1 predicted protein [Trichoplax adhaerens]|eukprot:XP_002113571.1 predicted protein [Trichoplax adhaerens]